MATRASSTPSSARRAPRSSLSSALALRVAQAGRVDDQRRDAIRQLARANAPGLRMRVQRCQERHLDSAIAARHRKLHARLPLFFAAGAPYSGIMTMFFGAGPTGASLVQRHQGTVGSDRAAASREGGDPTGSGPWGEDAEAQGGGRDRPAAVSTSLDEFLRRAGRASAEAETAADCRGGRAARSIRLGGRSASLCSGSCFTSIHVIAPGRTRRRHPLRPLQPHARARRRAHPALADRPRSEDRRREHPRRSTSARPAPRR